MVSLHPGPYYRVKTLFRGWVGAAKLKASCPALGSRLRTVVKQGREPTWSIASSPSTRTDESGDIIAKTRHTSTLWRINRNKSAITREVARTNVKDHNAFKIDFVAAIPWRPCEKASGGLGVDEFGPEILDDLTLEEF